MSLRSEDKGRARAVIAGISGSADSDGVAEALVVLAGNGLARANVARLAAMSACFGMTSILGALDETRVGETKSGNGMSELNDTRVCFQSFLKQ